MAINFPINTFHSDSWTCSFSNIPSISGVADLAIFDNFVKSLVLPDYNMTEIDSQFNGFRVRHPVVPKANIDLSNLQIEFKLNEDARNYLTIFEFMRRLRYAELQSQSNYDDLIRRYTIKSIILSLMDNQKRIIANIMFTNAFCLSLSSLSLTTGSADEITFTCNFSYEEILYERKNIFVGDCNV